MLLILMSPLGLLRDRYMIGAMIVIHWQTITHSKIFENMEKFEMLSGMLSKIKGKLSAFLIFRKRQKFIHVDFFHYVVFQRFLMQNVVGFFLSKFSRNAFHLSFYMESIFRTFRKLLEMIP